ncbi:MAG: LysR family transcriptional regulator, partial [Solirubrobacteraceae bacterium]
PHKAPLLRMNLPFSLRDLHYFVVAAEEGQLTKAALELHVAQPALSQSLARLEARLGTRLLERHPRGVSLTPAGELFFVRARAVLAAGAEAMWSVQPWARGEGRLSLGFTPSAQALARPLRRGFMERHPGVEIEICHLDVTERLANLRAGKIDVELLYPPPRDSELVTQTLLESPRHVVLSERHRLAGKKQLLFAEIAGETFPGRHPSVSEDWCREAWLTGYRGADPPVTAETALGLDELWALIYSGKAISVLPRFMLSATVGDGVRAIPLVDVPALEVVIARRREDRRPVVAAFFELCAESAELTGLPARGRPVAA